jgi:uncharacterized peroxidase-related enzyme
MSFLKTTTEEDATGDIAEIYAKESQQRGYVMDATKVMTTRPEILPAWEEFYSLVRGRFTLTSREWKLITLIAAKQIRSTYCSVVYGKALVDQLGSAEQVLEIQQDYHHAGLSERDVAMLEYAEKVCNDAPAVTQADIDRLRQHDFSDQQIFDIAFCASLRNFMSRFYDAVGASPDEEFRALDPSFRQPLTVGRPLE